MIPPELTVIAQTLRQSAFPKKFAVEVCADCNLACSMCHHPQMRRPKGVMPFELWKKCADQVAALSPGMECWFSFCGEPLLEAELLIRMLRYGKSIGLASLNVNTNGMPLTGEIAESLLDSGVDLVVFGVDGFTAQTYEGIRIRGKRDELYAKIEDLLDRRRRRRAGPEIMVQFIEMEENRHEIEDFRRYWLARGATLKIRHQLSWGGRFPTPLCIPAEDRIPCPWAITMMHVFWDGRVPRCPGDTEGDGSVGSAWHQPLATLWAALATYRDLHLSRHFDQLPPRCSQCKDWMTGSAERVRPLQAAGAA